MDRNSNEKIELSVVIPAFNEKENLPELYLKLIKVLDQYKSYELIFVDDGSTDGTFDVLKELSRKDARVKVIKLRRNFGKSAALAAGFDFSRGKVIVTMDADLQNDPEDIQKVLSKISDGYDFVVGWRAERKDPFLRKIVPSVIFNWLTSKITGVKLHDHDCGLKAFKKEVISNIRLFGDFHRFLPVLAAWNGAKVTEIKVRHHPRKHGKSKYGFKRLFRGLLDLIVVKFLMDYSTRPMHFFGIIGIFCFILGFTLGMYLTAEKLLFNASIGDRPLLILSVLLIVVGIQLLMMGLLGELLIRVYFESSGKDIYYIEEIIDESRISS